MSQLPRGELVYRLMVFILILVVIVLFFKPFSSSAPTSTAVPGRLSPIATPSVLPGGSAVSAVEACQLPASAFKGGQTLVFQWQLAVRADTPTESVLFFISDNNDFLCQAWRNAAGRYDNAVASLGGFQPTKGTALTYEIGIPEPIASTSASGEAIGTPAQLLIGQLPTGATAVDLLTSDQSPHEATLGHGWYLAWVTLAQAGDKVIEIDAVGANGLNLAHLANPAGLSVGATAAVSN